MPSPSSVLILGGRGRFGLASLWWPLIGALGLFMPTMALVYELRYLWRTPYALARDRLLALIGRELHTPFANAVRVALAALCMLAPGSAAGAQSTGTLRLGAPA